MINQSVVTLEGGWSQIQQGGIDRLESFLETGEAPIDLVQIEGKPKRIFGANDYSNLYTVVYNMCTQRSPNNWAEHLYERYGETLTRYIQQHVVPTFYRKSGPPLLEECLHRWVNHKIYVKWMDRFFAYLDRFYVKQKGVDTLNVRGTQIFKSLVFDPFKPSLTSAVLDFISEERASYDLPSDTVKGIVNMYIELGIESQAVYIADLEEPLLPLSAAFYTRQSALWLENSTLPEYCSQAEASMQNEERRVTRYLSPSTWPRLRQVLITSLLQRPQQSLLEKPTGPLHLLTNDRLDDLKRLYSLMQMVEGGLVPVATVFRQFVTAQGNSIVDSRIEVLPNIGKNDALADPSFVQAVMELHEKYRGVVQSCFSNDSLFQRSLKDAFESFLNREIGRFSFAQFLSSYCDRVLKKGGERLSDEAVEIMLTRAVDLFSYLTDKDMFAEIYKHQLSKRLLQETSSSEDAEKSLIQKLKLKCGAQFCSKLEGMISDMKIASEMQRDFREGMSNACDFDFSVLVLTTGFWPTYLPMESKLPVEFTNSLGVFEKYYQGKTDHRKLSWIHSLGMVSIAARFGVDDSRRYDIVMNTYQALIVLLFNSCESLSVAEMADQTGIEEGYLRKLLATLVISKFKVLNRTGSNPKAIDADESFSVNVEFSCPGRRIKIPAPTLGSEEAVSKERVEEDRSFGIQAAIVRIMKTRKTLGHQQLVTEVLSQLSLFKPNPKVVKQQIEALIEREFLARDETQPSVYNYLA